MAVVRHSRQGFRSDLPSTTVVSVSPLRVPIDSVPYFHRRPSYQDRSATILTAFPLWNFDIFRKGEPHREWELLRERRLPTCRVYVEMMRIAYDYSTWMTIVPQAYNFNDARVKQADVGRTQESLLLEASMVQLGLYCLCMHWLHLVIIYPNHCRE